MRCQELSALCADRMEIAPVGQLSAACRTVFSGSPAASITAAFVSSSIANVADAWDWQTPDPMQTSRSISM
jgi:hypothetical protein